MLIMSLMVIVGQSFEELGIAPNAAHILWRTGSFAFDTERIPFALVGTQATFESEFRFLPFSASGTAACAFCRTVSNSARVN
jgi:hypothetical protein